MALLVGVLILEVDVDLGCNIAIMKSSYKWHSCWLLFLHADICQESSTWNWQTWVLQLTSSVNRSLMVVGMETWQTQWLVHCESSQSNEWHLCHLSKGSPMQGEVLDSTLLISCGRAFADSSLSTQSWRYSTLVQSRLQFSRVASLNSGQISGSKLWH